MTSPITSAPLIKTSLISGTLIAMIELYCAEPIVASDESELTELPLVGSTAGLVRFRSGIHFFPVELRCGADQKVPGDAAAKYRAAFPAGVDGLFSDFTDEAFAACAAYTAAPR